MTEVERITDQLQRAMSGEAWHGPALMKLLEGVTAKRAAAHPVAGGHSIWELTVHINAWLRAGRRRLEGDRAQLSDAEDWPAIAVTSEQAWAEEKEALSQSQQELWSAITRLVDSQLDQPIIAGMSSTYVTLHGVIQHTLYHAGQIAILKRATEE